MSITVAKTENLEQKFMNKHDAMNYFGFAQKSKRTFERYVSEFKMNRDFGEGYLNPAGGLVLIEIQQFESFLRWKNENKYK